MEQIFTDAQLAALNKPLTKDEIETKNVSGATLTYIATWAAVKKANAIFGPGNWGYEVSGDFAVFETGKNSKGTTIYRIEVPVTLTVRNCLPIREIGDCEAQGDSAGAQSMGRKGAVSDGLKRCLKNFGAAFGLDLYDKDWKPEPAAPHTAPSQSQARPQSVTTVQTPFNDNVNYFMDRLNGVKTLDQLNVIKDALAEARIPKDHPRRPDLMKLYSDVRARVEAAEFGEPAGAGKA